MLKSTIYSSKIIYLFVFAILLISCSSSVSRRDINYEDEFENGKIAISQQIYVVG